jgi:AcrR family transcriptional regulator
MSVSGTGDTRSRLIQAATLLMAEHGIEGVELKEIQRAAGARNRSAIAYHFGGRDGLVRAIGAERRRGYDAERGQMLDRLERQGRVSVASLVDVLVEPLAAQLADEVGRAYLVVLAEAATRLGATGLSDPDRSHVENLLRVRDHLVRSIPGPRAQRRRTVGRAMLMIGVLVADVAREINRGELTIAGSRRRVREVSALITRSLGGDDDRVGKTES